MNTKSLPTPEEASVKYTSIITENLKKLLKATGYSQNRLSQLLEEHGLNLNQGTLSKYINDNSKIQLSVVVKICEIFDISISDLVDEHFQYESRVISLEELKMNSEDSNLVISKLGEKFITNPKNEYFRGYLQDYYCYFYPTLSGEEKLLTGILKLKGDSFYCEAELRLDTNLTIEGRKVYKHYTGCAVISKAVQSVYIILSSPEDGELCFINLRYFFIRHQTLDCRMAEVLTTSAGERHFPTIHRMLLSRTPIAEEHLRNIIPHLYLNSSSINIRKDEIQKLAEHSQQYKNLIEHLIHSVTPTEVYNLKEDFVLSNANQILASKEEARLFLSELRKMSLKMRYNKVSNKLDETVRELLLSLGYYKNPNTEPCFEQADTSE